METGNLITGYCISCCTLALGIFLGNSAGTLTIPAFKPKQLPKVIEVIIPFAIMIGIIKSFMSNVHNIYLSCLFIGLVFGYCYMKNEKEPGRY